MTQAPDGKAIESLPLEESATASRQAYVDIVWQQFRRNRIAYFALWLLVPLFLLAIYAPLLASNQPFVFFDGDQTLFPWWHALFHAVEPVDTLFNMALLASIPYLPIAFLLNFVWKHSGRTGLQRLGRLLLLYLGFTFALMVVVWGLGKAAEEKWIPHVLPKNTYSSRDFATEQFASGGKKYGWYPLLPFSPQVTDVPIRYRGPLFRLPKADWTRSTDRVPHLLGTDDVGRDVLMMMIYGTRISMTIGFVAVGIGLLIGCFLGAIAGYFGGWQDTLISRSIEVVLLFPAFFLILTLVAMIGPNIYVIMGVIGLTGWPTVARLIRGEVLKQRSMEYAMAAQAMGASQGRIIFRHILPNALAPALVAAPFDIASAIITEAGLSLLGFGVRPPAPSWGQLLQLANTNYSYWWLIVFPALAIFFTVTIFNLVGSGLRDAMDPRLRKSD